MPDQAGREPSPDGICTSLHPTLMVRCILKDSPHLTGKDGGRLHLFSTAWEDRDDVTPPARKTTLETEVKDGLHDRPHP